jgi:hypothetical protein
MCHEFYYPHMNTVIVPLRRLRSLLPSIPFVRTQSFYKDTEQAGSTGNASELYSEGAQFESQTGHPLARLRVFVVFLSTSR